MYKKEVFATAVGLYHAMTAALSSETNVAKTDAQTILQPLTVDRLVSEKSGGSVLILQRRIFFCNYVLVHSALTKKFVIHRFRRS